MTEKCDICGKFISYEEYRDQEYYESQTNFCHIECLNKESEEQDDKNIL